MGLAGATEGAPPDSLYQQKEQAFLDANDLSKYVPSLHYSTLLLQIPSIYFIFTKSLRAEVVTSMKLRSHPSQTMQASRRAPRTSVSPERQRKVFPKRSSRLGRQLLAFLPRN